VALVRIAGLKRAASGSLKNTGRKKVAKNRHLGTIAQLCQAISPLKLAGVPQTGNV